MTVDVFGTLGLEPGKTRMQVVEPGWYGFGRDGTLEEYEGGRCRVRFDSGESRDYPRTALDPIRGVVDDYPHY